jgi:hypothetical protein
MENRYVIKVEGRELDFINAYDFLIQGEAIVFRKKLSEGVYCNTHSYPACKTVVKLIKNGKGDA